MDLFVPDLVLRPATHSDLDFAWTLYRDLMKPLTEELLAWNEAGQRQVVVQALEADRRNARTDIILSDGAPAGWVHVSDTSGGIYLGQLYIVPALQGCGTGTKIVCALADKAKEESKALTLDVMKNNRARLLYERLGFRVIETSQYKLKMQWRTD